MHSQISSCALVESREPVDAGFDSNSGVIYLPNEVIIPGNTPTALIDLSTEASRIQKTILILVGSV